MYLKDYLRYRNVWLGVSIIWIMLFHIPFYYEFEFFKFLQKIGYGGVDICIFASGIGCYYSLHSDSDLGRFMKRRFLRLMPTYFIFLIFWFAYKFYMNELSFQMILGNIFTVQHFTGLGHAFNWYISAIILFYIVAPYLKLYVDRSSSGKKIFFFLFLLIFTVSFWNVSEYIIVVTRLPLFYLGLIVGSWCIQERKLTRFHLWFLATMFVIGIVFLILSDLYLSEYKWSHGLYWYPFILITPPLCVCISYTSHFFEKLKITRLGVTAITCIGEYSFELYLLHILIIDVVRALKERIPVLYNQYLSLFTTLILIAISCFLLKKATNLFKQKLR